MELKHLLKLLFKNKRSIILLGGLLGLGGVIISTYFPTTYQGSLVLVIEREIQAENPEYFSYEGYYAQQTAEKTADTLVGLLRSPELTRQALEKAGLPTDQASLKKTSRAIKASKTAPSVISLKVKAASKEQAVSLVSSLGNLAASHTPEKTVVTPITPTPLVSTQAPQPGLNGLVGLLVGVGLGVGAVLFKIYWKEVNEN